AAFVSLTRSFLSDPYRAHCHLHSFPTRRSSDLTGREFVVLRKNNRIIGFCRINDEHSPMIAQNVYWAPLITGELGGVGPLGIDENERGQGYGLAIVEAGLAFLRQRGICHIVIDWTDLVNFYKKLGFCPWKGYLVYQKEI